MTGAPAPPILVFAGPSLPPDARPHDGRFGWSPPAAAGDLVRLLDAPPSAVCLIDGYFDARPAPWHKELLLLAARGVALFGAASMGALRAAELHGLGMTGVGAVFRAYRDGLLTGDDEVACLHAPAELGWAALTAPMVEVRATLLAARRARLIGSTVARALRRRAHAVHFADRDWRAVEAAWTEVLPSDIVSAVLARRVPLKRLDAQACLALAAERLHLPPTRAPDPPRTCYLDALVAEVGAPSPSIAVAATANHPSPDAGCG